MITDYETAIEYVIGNTAAVQLLTNDSKYYLLSSLTTHYLQRSEGLSRPNSGGPRIHTEIRDAFLRLLLCALTGRRKSFVGGVSSIVLPGGSDAD
jgi:hypothetical protein